MNEGGTGGRRSDVLWGRSNGMGGEYLFSFIFCGNFPNFDL